jgi:hypothetical protein
MGSRHNKKTVKLGKCSQPKLTPSPLAWLGTNGNQMTPPPLEVGNKLVQVGNKPKSILTPCPPLGKFPKFYRFFISTAPLTRYTKELTFYL